MRYLDIKSLAATLRVSKIAFGTGSNIKSLSDPEIFRLFDRYADAGGNCLDTAPGYVGGRSEDLIGKWHESRKNRDRILIGTKAGHPAQNKPEQGRLSRQDILDDLHASLKALRTDYVDIFWLHKDDPSRPVEDIVESIQAVVESGLVRMIGCSNWRIDRIQQANSYARDSGQSPFLASQIQWSLARTREEDFAAMGVLVMDDESYDWYAASGMPVFGFSSNAQGFFAKVAAEGVESLSREIMVRYASPENMRRAEKVACFAAARGVSVSAAVIAYVINNRVPGVAVISCKTTEHLDDSLSAMEVTMSARDAELLIQP